MNSLFTKGVVMFGKAYNHQVINVKKFNQQDEGKYSFEPGVSLRDQASEFKDMVKAGLWNGNLAFQKFKGTFKIEYWIFLESQLRELNQLSRIKFIDTQLDKQHLDMLLNLLQWIDPRQFSLKFKQNELDNLDMAEFIMGLFEKELRINQLLIISNPGIFKGDLIEKLTLLLTNSKYHLEIDRDCCSIGIQLKEDIDEKWQEELSNLQNQIHQTLFYEFNFQGCFTESNSEAFNFLMTNCYHEDYLEQLQSLNVNDCYLGSQSQFSQLCQGISSAKGLLNLSIRNQPLLHNAVVMDLLLGNRYDSLYMNFLDIGDNQELSEKAFKELAYRLIPSLQKFESSGSLGQTLPTIFKLFILIEGLKAADQIMLRELDLSAVENYNRHDLSEQLLSITVFNPKSKVKKLTTANLDEGRMKSYSLALGKCKERIQLEEIVVASQRYRQLTENQKEFTQKLIFTPVDNLVFELKRATFLDAFNVEQRKEGYYQALFAIEKLCSLEELSFINSSMYHKLEELTLYLFSDKFKLKKLVFETFYLDFEVSEIINKGLEYCKDNKTTLESLTLKSFYQTPIEMATFINLFFFKMQLKEVILSELPFFNDDTNISELEMYITSLSPDFQLPLKTLEIGNLNYEGDNLLLSIIVLAPYSRIQKLSLEYCPLINLKSVQLPDLIDLSLINITQGDWEQISDIFIFGPQLYKLHLGSMTLTNEMYKAMKKSQGKATKKDRLITILSLSSCALDCPFLELFLNYEFAFLTELSVDSCTNWDQCITQCSKLPQQKYSFVKVSLNNTWIEDEQMIKYFLHELVFKREYQRLEELAVISCFSQELGEKFLKILGAEIKILKDYQTSENLKRYLRLRVLTLNYLTIQEPNPWIALFKSLLNSDIKQVTHDENEEEIPEITKEADQTRELIEKDNLRLAEKVQYNSIYKSQSPKITDLSLSLDYASLVAEDQALKLYENVIQGFIFSSHLKQLSLTGVNLEQFIIASENLTSKNPSSELNIEEFTISPTTYDIEEQFVSQFTNIYLIKNRLKKLNIKGYFPKIVPIMTSMTLTHLSIDSSCELNANESLRFIEFAMNLESLTLTAQVELTACTPNINQCNLHNLDIYLTDQSITILKPLIPMLMVRLKTLTLTHNDAPDLLDTYLGEKSYTGFSIKELSLKYRVQLYKYLDLFRAVNLDILKIDTLTTESITDFDFEPKECKLEIVNGDYDSNIGIAYNKFVFMYTHLKLQHLFSFQYYEFSTHIRHLDLSFGLLYNSSESLSIEALERLSNTLIYNEKSILETLILHSCHFKPEHITALCSAADSFTSLKQDYYLPLKHFNIYYSLYIGEEGVKTLSEKLLFHPNIALERFEFEVTNLNDTMVLQMCADAEKWIKYQRENKRSKQVLQFRHLDLGRNEFVQSQEAWFRLCDVFIFSDLTPHLEILFIHFLAMNDMNVAYLCQKALNYFNRKGRNYIYPVKKLNYSLNTALTYKGWNKICKEFFFHPKVQIKELFLEGCQIDSQQKIEAILSVAKHSKHLESLLTYNMNLKDGLRCQGNAIPLEYLPVDINYDTQKNGLIEGLPDSFGNSQTLITRAIYQVPQFINNSNWDKIDKVRFSPLHLELADHFLKPLDTTELVLNYRTLDQLCQLYIYDRQGSGEPYPFGILFQEPTYEYLRTESRIEKIALIPQQLNYLEEINQLHILEIWKKLSQAPALDTVRIEYTLNDDLVDKMFAQGYTERDILNLIRLIPPSKIRLQDSLTLQAIKGIYSVFWECHHFQYANMTYDINNYLNMGIGYSLREWMYHSRYRCKRLFYYFFSLFVNDADIYKFNTEVIRLNEYLSTQKLVFVIIAIMNLLYFAVIIIGPVYFTHYYLNDQLASVRDEICQKGPDAGAYYLYAVFAALSLAIEAYVFKKVSAIVPSFLKQLIVLDLVDEAEKQEKLRLKIEQKKQQYKHKTIEPESNQVVPANEFGYKEENTLQKIKTKSKSTLKKMSTHINQIAGSEYGQWASYLQSVILSQLAKFDIFNDIGFILRCYYCGNDILYILSLIVTVLNIFMSLYRYIILIFEQIMASSRKKQLSTNFVNDFFGISIIGRNLALSQLLDQVAPFNVTVIPNNFITQFIMPNQAGKSINNSVKNFLLQFALQDLPQILLQIFFLIAQSAKNGTQGWSMYVTIAISGITILTSFRRFMAIRPSTLSQTDFDLLALEKTKTYTDETLKQLQSERLMIERFTNMHGKPKSMSAIEEQSALLEQQ